MKVFAATAIAVAALATVRAQEVGDAISTVASESSDVSESSVEESSSADEESSSSELDTLESDESESDASESSDEETTSGAHKLAVGSVAAVLAVAAFF
ncbi:hypothetical protein EV183_003674 [Coemansia sp. RSA 2336]|nr:hypothetical protein EV183_003674 [Coemansia sp. RSA 2336]